MQYFVADFLNPNTQLSIIDGQGEIIDQQTVRIEPTEYVNQLAEYIIELSHENHLYHDDIKAIGLSITDISAINYSELAQLKTDLESKFGFSAYIEQDHDNLVHSLIQYK